MHSSIYIYQWPIYMPISFSTSPTAAAEAAASALATTESSTSSSSATVAASAARLNNAWETEEIEYLQQFFKAVEHNDTATISTLLAGGLDVNSQIKLKVGDYLSMCSGKFSALSIAVFYGHLESCEVLLRAGADINQNIKLDALSVGQVYDTPLFKFALIVDQIQVFKFLLRQESIKIPERWTYHILYAAAQKGDPDLIHFIINIYSNRAIQLENVRLNDVIKDIEGERDTPFMVVNYLRILREIVRIKDLQPGDFD